MVAERTAKKSFAHCGEKVREHKLHLKGSWITFLNWFMFQSEKGRIWYIFFTKTGPMPHDLKTQQQEMH